MNANLYALLRAHFPQSAEQPCLLIPEGSVIHYGDLDAASARMAHALLAAGCQPGDRVAVGSFLLTVCDDEWIMIV